MLIVRNNIGRIGHKCTIYEFVVIGIFLYEMEAIMWIDKLRKVTFYDSIYYVFRNNRVCFTSNDFLIFFKDLI